MATNQKQLERKIKSVDKSIAYWIKAIKQAISMNRVAISQRDTDEFAYRLAKGYRQHLPPLYKELEWYKDKLKK